jgi:hypothetical protein
MLSAVLTTYQLVEFIRPADRGACSPFVGRGVVPGQDAQASLFIKTRAGYGNRPAASGVELFTTLLARELSLLAPEPAIVIIPERFSHLVMEAPKHADLIAQSPGANFATLSLGPDWKTLIAGPSQRVFREELLENILIFDALVQHTDREPRNPNLLWKGREIALLDHEGCFAHVSRFMGSRSPWREYLSIRPLTRHCLSPEGKRIAQKPDFGRSFRERTISFEFTLQHHELASVASAAFPESRVVLSQITAYLDSVFRQFEAFLDFVKLNLSA